MQKMTVEECRSFLLARQRTAKVATVRADSRPHIAPVWFVLDGDTLIFTTWHASVKAINLRRDPRISICVDDETPPFAFVQLEGHAELLDSPDELRHWATQIAGRYMGAEQAETYGQRNAVAGELLVRVSVTKLMGQKDVAGW